MDTSRKLRLFEVIDDDTHFIAHYGELEAREFHCQEAGDWSEKEKQRLIIKQLPHDKKLTICDETGQNPVVRTVAEWLAEQEGPGYVGSTCA